jgi:hypothetical protein
MKNHFGGGNNHNNNPDKDDNKDDDFEKGMEMGKEDAIEKIESRDSR